MNYAVWIALAVVFIAVVPPIIKNARARNRGDCGTSGNGGANSSSTDSSCDAGSDGGGDCSGGD